VPMSTNIYTFSRGLLVKFVNNLDIALRIYLTALICLQLAIPVRGPF
jgi:hypothetical protein